MVVNLKHLIKVRTDEWSELTVLIHLIEHLLGPDAESPEPGERIWLWIPALPVHYQSESS